GRADQIPAAGAFPGHRLLRVRHRSGRLRVPALLLHGADRLGRQTATGIAAAEGRQRPLARVDRRAERLVPRRAVPRAAGLVQGQRFFPPASLTLSNPSLRAQELSAEPLSKTICASADLKLRRSFPMSRLPLAVISRNGLRN